MSAESPRIEPGPDGIVHVVLDTPGSKVNLLGAAVLPLPGKSTDYRSRLGIVSLVRRDFERLSELADPDSDKRNAELMAVERIILYIDDLDRCKPDRVIEVLEAVHLLLAFRLFMVVVAVDPRWLRRCLEKHYPDLLALRTQEMATVAHVVPSRPATAQDYLEKIFQIPFTPQPLKADGYRRLIRGLTELNRMARGR